MYYKFHALYVTEGKGREEPLFVFFQNYSLFVKYYVRKEDS